MRLFSLALALLASAFPLSGRAADLVPPPPSAQLAKPPPVRVPGALPRFGLALGAGFPDFATASLVFRPTPRVRLFAGPSWNTVGWGIQGGVGFVPWSRTVSPVLTAEAGRFFGNDLRFLARNSGGIPDGMEPLLADIDYSYAAVDVGLEIGSQRSFCASFRLGLSYVSMVAHGTSTYTSGGDTVSLSDPAFHGTLPSVKVGVQYWF